MIGFAGPSIPTEVRALAREFDLGGVVLFKRNVEDPAQVAELSFEARRLSDTPLWVAVDQEGGRVARLRRPFTEWPPMATLGRAGNRTLVERFAAALARELAAVGITMDFAPVLDTPANPAIGDRALSDDPPQIAEYGRLIIAALQAERIAACAKHFPGHSESNVDPHLDLPLLDLSPERFRAVEYGPFRAAVEADVATIMVGHLLVPAFDETRPTSLSRRVVHEELRRGLRYDGLICTDDLDMKAISARQPLERAAVQAVDAGCDLLLACGTDHDLHARMIEAIIRAAEQGELRPKEVEDAAGRQQRAKARFLSGVPPRPLPAATLAQVLATVEHTAIAEEMASFG
jgi:beta-N-acetylhexosaminidase